MRYARPLRLIVGETVGEIVGEPKKKTMDFSTERLHRRCIQVRSEYKASANWEQWFLLTADQHFDSVKCDRQLLKKHHKKAVERRAGIFSFGDTFDVMQGKKDRRGSKDDVRPEYQGGNYYDRVINDAADWYSQYAPNYILKSYGNHETAILKHQETDVLKRLVEKLNGRGGNIELGAYSGWVVFRFSYLGDRTRTIRLFYHHGYGGGGPVTKGTIQTNRRAVYLPDADLIVTGHIHESWKLETMQERIKRNGTPYLATQVHLQLPTYKEEYMAGKGWHVERGAPPKPTGGAWLRFYFDGSDDSVKYEIIRAR